MAFTTPAATDPIVSVPVLVVPAGFANTFRPNINASIASEDVKVQRAQALLELLTGTLGFGTVYSTYGNGAITIGTGLSVTIAGGAAMVGSFVSWTSPLTVSVLDSTAPNYLFLRQDGTWTVSASSVTPSSADGHGAALQWGTATTVAGAVTVVTNQRAAFLGLRLGGHLVKPMTTTTYTLLPNEYLNNILEFTGNPTGASTVTLPLIESAQWTVMNNQSGGFTLTVIGATGTGITIANGKRVQVYCDSANIVSAVTDIKLLGSAASGANADITSLSAITSPLTLFQGGTASSTAAGARSSLGVAASGVNADITSLTGVTTALPITSGGTGALTAAAARTNLAVAASGANSDILSLAGLTTPITVAQGGNGGTTQATARAGIGAAARGINSDITALNALTIPSAPRQLTVTTQVANYTVTASDDVILLNASGFTATLPTAVGITGRVYTIKLISAASTGTVATTSSQTIDGSTTFALAAQYNSVTLISDAANWQILAKV